MNRSAWANLKNDMPAGIVVFLVAVPLCLGIALASGAPFFSGLIAGIVGGIVVGCLSNSNLSVSGPAAGLTAIVLAGITSLGAFEIFLVAVVLAGVIQLLLGLLKAGIVANYIPGNVIKGMLTAIGIIIILKQIPHAFGYDKNFEGQLDFRQPDGSNTFSSLFDALSNIHLGVTLITLVCLAVLILWEKPFMKKMKVVPGALVAVIMSISLNQVFSVFFPSLAVNGNHLVQVPVAKSVEEFTALFTFPDFSAINKDVIFTAFTLAVVASVETLLCIEAVDKLDPQRRVTSQNRELKAQGIGNIVSGLMGGLPITSVIVRSSANVNAGARTKLSTVFHGILILVCTILIPGWLNLIPLGALAAILLLTGYKLARISIFKQMFANGKYQWAPFLITVVAIVLADNLLLGVGLGLAASIFAILYGNMKNSYYFHKEDHHEGELIRIHLSEEVSFLNKASIKLTLDHLPANSTVVIDATETKYIDFDVLEFIREFKDLRAKQKNINCLLWGFKEKYGIANTYNVHSEKMPHILTKQTPNVA